MRFRAIPTLFRLSASGHTDGLVNSVAAAWDLAALRGHASITPEHLLAGIIKAGERRPHTILHRMGILINADAVTELIGPPRAVKQTNWLRFDQASLDLLSAARHEARGMGCPYIGTEHLILALLLGPTQPAADYLRGQRIEAAAVRQAANHSALPSPGIFPS